MDSNYRLSDLVWHQESWQFSDYMLRQSWGCVHGKCNQKNVNFLDVTLDLTSGNYYLYSEPNNSILYAQPSTPELRKPNHQQLTADCPTYKLITKSSTKPHPHTKLRLRKLAINISYAISLLQQTQRRKIASETSYGIAHPLAAMTPPI